MRALLWWHIKTRWHNVVTLSGVTVVIHFNHHWWFKTWFVFCIFNLNWIWIRIWIILNLNLNLNWIFNLNFQFEFSIWISIWTFNLRKILKQQLKDSTCRSRASSGLHVSATKNELSLAKVNFTVTWRIFEESFCAISAWNGFAILPWLYSQPRSSSISRFCHIHPNRKGRKSHEQREDHQESKVRINK